jgi:2-(1,2-epoxy-1,2-dihydrophenyl)acetyl-CoA isomerase
VSAVTLEVLDGVAHLELNRPDAANSVDLALARALRTAVDRVAVDDDVRAVLVTGAGKRFCAGGDVASFADAEDPRAYLHRLATEADAAVRALAGLAKPVVAGVHGAVAGAGLAVALSCDLVVADPATKFVFAYPGIGLTPDCGVSWLLPRAVGQQRALELALTGRTLSGEEALAWGMVAETSSRARSRARELAEALASGPAAAHGRTRHLLRTAWETDRVSAGAVEARTIAERIASSEAQGLIEQFVSRPRSTA